VCMGVDVAGLRADLLRLISHLDELDAAAPVALRISVGGRR
jgi:hypothetical protein